MVFSSARFPQPLWQQHTQNLSSRHAQYKCINHMVKFTVRLGTLTEILDVSYKVLDLRVLRLVTSRSKCASKV